MFFSTLKKKIILISQWSIQNTVQNFIKKKMYFIRDLNCLPYIYIFQEINKNVS